MVNLIPYVVQDVDVETVECVQQVLPAQLQAEWIFVPARRQPFSLGKKGYCTGPPHARSVAGGMDICTGRCQPLSLGKKGYLYQPSASHPAAGGMDICTSLLPDAQPGEEGIFVPTLSQPPSCRMNGYL